MLMVAISPWSTWRRRDETTVRIRDDQRRSVSGSDTWFCFTLVSTIPKEPIQLIFLPLALLPSCGREN